ncbi:hypothetical protein [Mesorhizobium sp. CN2-181]|uniref:hypothetical protein n=1 Tax=Mesorhizobium yinganensis TaxID=3157707 RepID=UPI0032B85C33
MVAIDGKAKPSRVRSDWHAQFIAARNRMLIELGIENHALTVYDGWRSMHEHVIQRLAKRAHSRPSIQSAVRISLGLLPFARTRKLYKASLAAIRALDANGDGLPELLTAMAEFETIARAAPFSAGSRILELLSSEGGRAQLIVASEQALSKHPDSPFLIYVHSASVAKNGNIPEAHDFVMAAIRRCQEDAASGLLTERNRRRYKQLDKVWRVIDTISRDAATWSDGSGGDTPAWAKSEASPADLQTSDGASADHGDDQQLVFSERYLQGRQYDRYLDICKRKFDKAKRLHEKFGALRDMLREGLRRIADYHAPYNLASACFEEIGPEWRKLAEPSYIDSRKSWTAMRATAKLLAEALQLARQLRRIEDAALLERSLLYLANKPAAATAIWTACHALVGEKSDAFVDETIAIITKSQRHPEGDADIREFFIWARRVQRFDLAHAIYDRLPSWWKASIGVPQYAAILQQEGQFARAAELVRTVNANMLRQPGTLDANYSWSQIRRAGELEFAAETAERYGSIPQPRSPQGVIFLAARGLVQMRLYPLVVLMEMKKRGWAVVPLTKGALPLEPTGVAEIDRFLGCMTLEGQIDRKVADHFPAVSGFEADILHGKLRWNALDLDHVLWEDAAINRRRYTVDYTCPSLRGVLERLTRWTKTYCSVLEAAKDTLVAHGTRCGFVVLQQSRLPDAIVRFRLQEIADPDNFFCVHSSNGYENYFVNFKSAVSTRTALRNLTRHPQMRTASFPVPVEFEAFYHANRARAPEMLRSVQDITRMRRSTAGLAERLPEAEACMKRILSWREAGGKVACLFGKVVCDSGVPFDGGPAHSSMKDWLNHSIESVRGSGTLLLIKPHPHEMRNEIGVFLTEWFSDLIEGDLPDNVILLGHRWFDLHDLDGLIDLGVIYNGTSAAELGVLGIPSVLANHFAPIDYPIGHAVPTSRPHFRDLLRFEQRALVAPDLRERAAAWLTLMSSGGASRDYRYHARPITNKIVYPPWWFPEDIERYELQGDRNVELLTEEIVAKGSGNPDLKAAE